MEAKYLKINPADNVAVAITALPAGEKLTVDGKEITLNEDVPAGHKFALKDFAESENVIKYGYPIGHARKAQKQGDWMNENNIKTNLSGLLEYTYNPVNVDLNTTTLNLNTGAPNLTFRGYKRKNGDVGVRNEIWIIPTVGCVNGIINQLAEGLRRETGGKGVDAIMAYPHNYGCSQLGDDHENTKKILRDMVLHPNAGAVLVVGLGCENNQPGVFREFLRVFSGKQHQHAGGKISALVRVLPVEGEGGLFLYVGVYIYIRYIMLRQLIREGLGVLRNGGGKHHSVRLQCQNLSGGFRE